MMYPNLEPLDEEEREFAEKNHNLIYSFLRKHNLSVEEWYGVVAIGYIQAVKKYDPSRGAFYNFAYTCMLNMVRMEERKVRLQNQWVNGVLSLDAEYGEGKGVFLRDLIPDKEDMDSLYRYREFIHIVEELPKDLRDVISLKVCGYNQVEIGSILGYSQSKVSKLFNQALREIRNMGYEYG